MYSPTHLNNFIACKHLSLLEKAAHAGELKRTKWDDPIAELIRKQGQEHERKYLQSLREKSLNIVEIGGADHEDRVKRTITAMKAGAEVIWQAALKSGQWRGYADFLIKVNTPSALGDYSYIIEDAKLSAEVKGEAIMQLCIYAELIREIQGKYPDEIAVVNPGGRYAYSPAEFLAYLRYVQKKFIENKDTTLSAAIELPDPVDRCHTCGWRGYCEDQWHEQDHLKLVAGASRIQRKELKAININTLAGLALTAEVPRLQRGSPESAEKIYLQAKIQYKERQTLKPEYEFITPVIVRQGLAGLPEPSPGDIWFDIEGDGHIGDLGLEYLFGWVIKENGAPEYYKVWSLNNQQEKKALEEFLMFVMEKRKSYPGLHIYHYGHYETTVLKRLSTRYNSFVDEVDDLLRQEVFINLNRVVKNGLRLSVEGYGLKDIERHYGFDRKTDLGQASRARKHITLLLDSHSSLDVALTTCVQDYNEEDCLSTLYLHKWLEEKREELVTSGTEVSRFSKIPEEVKAKPELEELALLSQQLYSLLPEDQEDLAENQKVIKVLADLMLWYRREDKSHWWDFFRMKDLSADELMDERKGLAGPFEFLGQIGKEKQSGIYRWKFKPQVFEGEGEELHFSGEAAGRFSAFNFDGDQGFIDLKLGPKLQKDYIPKMETTQGIIASTLIPSKNQIARLRDIGESVAENRQLDDSEFDLVYNLLKRKQVIIDLLTHKKKSDSILKTAKDLTAQLKTGTILPIQGPPGTGKTFTAAHMICELIKNNKKVGITAQSHAVVLNLLYKVHEISAKCYPELKLNAIKQLGTGEDGSKYTGWIRGMNSKEIDGENNFNVIGGTSWLWSRGGMADMVDVLFIDEAGQFALADAVAVSRATKSLVLLGDPQQLENVTQGVHPPEIEVSVLGYWLDNSKVIDDDQGLFLGTTYRMHPDVNEFISEVFYEQKLDALTGLENQRILSSSVIKGSGLRYLPCLHEGNQSSSMEEVQLIRQVLLELMKDGKWRDKDGNDHPLEPKDVLIVAPYNAHVNLLKEELPEFARYIGTVDKFQGRQAPVVIYSMATSSAEEAPRGMEFLYSLNRLNVAVSRAQCIALLVASPDLFEYACKTPNQMKLANAYCRYLEMAEEVRM